MIATHSTALCSCAQYNVVSMLCMLKRGGFVCVWCIAVLSDLDQMPCSVQYSV